MPLAFISPSTLIEANINLCHVFHQILTLNQSFCVDFNSQKFPRSIFQLWELKSTHLMFLNLRNTALASESGYFPFNFHSAHECITIKQTKK